MRVKFLLDADMPRSTAEVFGKQRLRVEDVRDLGLGRASDKRILAFANKKGFIVVTRDLEFGNPLLCPLNTHKGVLILRLPNRFSAQQIAEQLHAFLKEVNVKELVNAVTVLELEKYRIRK